LLKIYHLKLKIKPLASRAKDVGLKLMALLGLTAFLILLTGTLWASEIFRGQVERVNDGDTLTLLTNDYERVKVRLYGIDAPELAQSGGEASKAALERLVRGLTVEVESIDVDRYSRQVGLVRLKDRLINLELIEEGQAWVYERYCKLASLCRSFRQAQKRARESSVGLWRESDPKPPWEFRQNHRRGGR
jgi:endonuclease YncB( thermonuclease family)